MTTVRKKLDDASAGELREFVARTFDIEVSPIANRAAMKKKLRDLGYTGDEIEVSGAVDEVPPALQEEEAPGVMMEPDPDSEGFTPEKLLEALVASGMAEDEARQVAGLTAQNYERLRAGSDGLVYGPGKENLYVTISIARGQGRMGNVPVPVMVNGVRQDIPRGVPWPVRTPFVEALMHAETIEYEEVVDAPHLPRRYIPRKSLSYPTQIMSSRPYDLAEARRVAEESTEALRSMGVQVPQMSEAAAA